MISRIKCVYRKVKKNDGFLFFFVGRFCKIELIVDLQLELIASIRLERPLLLIIAIRKVTL